MLNALLISTKDNILMMIMKEHLRQTQLLLKKEILNLVHCKKSHWRKTDFLQLTVAANCPDIQLYM